MEEQVWGNAEVPLHRPVRYQANVTTKYAGDIKPSEERAPHTAHRNSSWGIIRRLSIRIVLYYLLGGIGRGAEMDVAKSYNYLCDITGFFT